MKLVEQGANVNTSTIHGNYRTLLMLASGAGNQPVVQELLNRGALVDLYDLTRDAALILSAYNGHNNIVRMLVVEGANINHKAFIGKSAQELSEKNRALAQVIKEGLAEREKRKEEAKSQLLSHLVPETQ